MISFPYAYRYLTQPTLPLKLKTNHHEMFGLRVVPLLRHPRCHTASPLWPPRDCFRSGITLTKELDCGKYFWLPSMMRWDNTERERFILLNGSNLQIQWQNLRIVIHPLITGLMHPISDELQDFSTQFRQIPHFPWISIKKNPWSLRVCFHWQDLCNKCS